MASFQKRCGSWRAIITKKGFHRATRTFDTKADATSIRKTTHIDQIHISADCHLHFHG